MGGTVTLSVQQGKWALGFLPLWYSPGLPARFPPQHWPWTPASSWAIHWPRPYLGLSDLSACGPQQPSPCGILSDCSCSILQWLGCLSLMPTHLCPPSTLWLALVGVLPVTQLSHPVPALPNSHSLCLSLEQCQEALLPNPLNLWQRCNKYNNRGAHRVQESMEEGPGMGMGVEEMTKLSLNKKCTGRRKENYSSKGGINTGRSLTGLENNEKLCAFETWWEMRIEQ